MRILSLLSITLIVLLSTFASFAEENSISKVFSLMKKDKWRDAHKLAVKIENAPLQKIVLSQQFLDSKYSENKFEDIIKFLNKNPNWPQRYLLNIRAENLLNETIKHNLILKWFDKNPPLTPKGYKYYSIAALSLMKNQDKIKKNSTILMAKRCFFFIRTKIIL